MLQGKILHHVQVPQLLTHMLDSQALDIKGKEANVNARGKWRAVREKKEELSLHFGSMFNIPFGWDPPHLDLRPQAHMLVTICCHAC